MKMNFLKIMVVAALTFTATSCGDEKSDNLEDQLEERSEELEDRSEELEDASDDLEDATEDIEDAMEDLEEALDEMDDPAQRERIRERVNKMIDDMNTQQ